MEREVKPEILDSLAPDDPAAIRSRKDLRLINWFIRGESWIIKKLGEFQNLTRVVEIGAGEGVLANYIKKHFPYVEVIAIDLQPATDTEQSLIEWRTGDVLESDEYDSETVVVANLLVHHLDEDQLLTLGEKISHCRGIIMSEPHRYWFSKLIGYTLYPFLNHVTKHDMIVSIEAGFRFGELPGLFEADWHWDESPYMGAIRSIGRKV